ncbi:MAG: PolC-type DNA polymerase III [Eubacteriales bacterium]|nr:PolC-type DNA polymerase III [Eubacteriales bacterium]
MFPFCAAVTDSCGGLDKVLINNVHILREELIMDLDAMFPRMPAPAETAALSARIAAEFGLREVHIRADWPREERKVNKKSSSGGGKVLLGRKVKGPPVDIGTLNVESGRVIVCGEVFACDSRHLPKNDAAVLSFSMTDYTGSIHVSKYFRSDEDQELLDLIHVGDRLTIQGDVTFSRYDNDLALSPRSIVREASVHREDTAEEKRVELHLHTRYSALDALTDPSAAVKQAAAWGHKAVAITDHGVAQAFPEAWHAGQRFGIKVIYGLEGYFYNDVDDVRALYGAADMPLDTEFVAFDLETTGLDPRSERMTEIGAVILSGGKIVRELRTFVNPGRPIPPEVVALTGITDRDVFDAPDEETALRLFLDFAGDRPLAAHNAQFDLSFLQAAAERAGIVFDPPYADTLALSRSLLPGLGRYKLDIVARHLELPEFQHHRAADDAATAARILEKLLAILQERGAATLGEAQDILRSSQGGFDRRRIRHISLLVRNPVGLKNLYKLISLSHLEHYKYQHPIIPKSLLQQYREGILVGAACAAGEVFDALVHGRSESELLRLASFYDYLEIMPLCNNRFLIEEGRAEDEEALRELNRRILALGKTLGKPVAATSDVHFLEPEHEIYRRILLASKKFADADRELPIYFKTTDEMLEEFSYLGEAEAHRAVIEVPNALADLCEEIQLLPKGLFAPKLGDSAGELQQLVYGRMKELYGENPPEIVRTRVETELRDILSRHYDVIYMSAQKLVSNSLKNGYLVGSRGSVGSSLVAYLSGITEVNSLPAHYRCPQCQYTDFESGKDYGCGADMPDRECPECGVMLAKDGFDIPFETFLGFGGDKVPDIDLNFSGEYQARAHKYTEELFGRDHVFRAGTIGTLAEKTAYGYVKKYLEERGKVVTKAEENRLAAGCVGVKRTTGQHPGGLVIIPQDMDVTDFCPVQRPADDPNTDIITTHFEYHCMEDNLLKLDELGHDDPTMLRMLEDMTNVNVRTIPLDDPKTRKIFRTPTPLGLPDNDPIIGKTGTIGIPEFGTAFTRQMLVDTTPEDFDTLVRLSGFSHGTDVWAGNIRELILGGVATVRETVGCRDDIMLYLISKGMNERRAFQYMEAVRKGAIHKGKPWPDGIVEEMQSLGVPEWYIESCRKIQYLFPKAHAVAYVMMAFRIAWFKVHEPLAYYSAYFYRRSRKDGFEAESMLHGIDTVRRRIAKIRANPNATAKEEDLLTTLEAVYEFYLRGFRFLPIDLYRSDASRFLPEDGALRPPFVAIGGLGESAAQALVASRANGRQFISVEDLSDACPKVSKAHLEQLRAEGALGDMPESSQLSLF